MAGKTSEWRPGSTVCRCCLTEGCYKDISTEYFWMGKREVYAEMLSDTLNVSISYAQTGGRLICEPCIARLRDASDFKRQVQDCEKTFMNHLDPSTSKSSVHVEVESLEDVKMERVKVEKDASDDDDDYLPGPDFGDDDDDDDLDDEPLTKLASAKVKVPKKEAVEILDMLDTSQITVKRKASSKTKEPPKKVKKKEIVVKPTTSKAKQAAAEREKKKKGTTDTKKKTLRPLFQVDYDWTLGKPLGTFTNFNKSRGNKINNKAVGTTTKSPLELPDAKSNVKSEDKLKKSKFRNMYDLRQNVLTVFEFSTAYPFIGKNNDINCIICGMLHKDLVTLKLHMANHDFQEMAQLVQKRREKIYKVDVSDLTCKVCNTSIKTIPDLKIHLKDIHKKVIDTEIQDNIVPYNLNLTKEGYQCAICGENFMLMRALAIHMNNHFSNYSCEVCGAGFMTQSAIRKHLQDVHETGNFPCDQCDKTYTNDRKRSVHIKQVHLKQLPRKCPMCPERFGTGYKRIIHLQNVHNQVTRVYKCETCGISFHLKYHLVIHMRSVHMQEKNFQCDVCPQAFYSKQSLKRHMVIHTGERNFKCHICRKTFFWKRNLVQHFKVHNK